MFAINLLFIQMFLIYSIIFVNKRSVIADKTKLQLFLTATFVAILSNKILVIDHSSLTMLSYRLNEILQVIAFKRFYFLFMDQLPNELLQTYSFYIKLASATLSTVLVLFCTRSCMRRNSDPSYTPKRPSIRLNYHLIVFILLPFMATWANRYRFPTDINGQITNGIALLSIITITVFYYPFAKATSSQSSSLGFFGKLFSIFLIIQLLFMIDITFKIGLLVWAVGFERGNYYGYYPTSPSYTIFNALTAINTLFAFLLSFKLFRTVQFRPIS